MEQFFITDGSNKIGPFTREQIEKMILDSRISITDPIYSTKDRAWKEAIYFFSQFGASDEDEVHRPKTLGGISVEETSTNIKGLLPIEHELEKKVKPTQPQDMQSQIGQMLNKDLDLWLVKKTSEVLGPFTYVTILGMIQEKTVNEFDLVCKTNSLDWKKVSDTYEFSKEFLDKLKNQNKDFDQIAVNLRRKSPRVQLNKKIELISSKGVACKAIGIDLSHQGVGIVIRGPWLKINDQVHILLPTINDHIVKFKGMVKNNLLFRSAGVDEDFHQFGIQFVDLSDEQKAIIDKMMQTLV